VWGKGGEEAGNSRRRSEVFWMWREGTQEVGVFKYKEEKTRESGTTAESVGEGEGT